MLDMQVFFNIAVTLVGAMGGWILGRITKSLDQLDKDVRELPMIYVTKVDYRNDLHDIKELLHRIDNKLDGKVDK